MFKNKNFQFIVNIFFFKLQKIKKNLATVTREVAVQNQVPKDVPVGKKFLIRLVVVSID